MLQTRLSDLRLTGATVLRDGTLQNRTVAIAGGRIGGGPYPVVDLTGYYILPGIIDLHATAPDPDYGAMSDPCHIEARLDAADRTAAAGGVTTGWFAQGWSWEGGCRSPEMAEAMMAGHAARRTRLRTDLRLQIAYETHAVDTADRLLAAVRRFGIGFVLLNNSLDAMAALWAKDPDAVERRAGLNGRTGLALMEMAQAARARNRDMPRSLCKLAEAFDAHSVIYGSQGEADGETREFFSALGARICFNPTAFPAASVAKALGEPVLMPAADILRKGHHQGAISAMALIRAGKCAGLVSDGDPAALAQAAFALVDHGVMDLSRAWAMISATPARIMRLTDRGEIAPGKRADLVIVDKQTRAVEGTIVAGRVVHLAGNAAHRFPGDGPLGMAAE